jgi:hypothetical protein
MKEIFVGKIMDISRQVSPDLLRRVSAGYGQRVVVGESVITRTQMGEYKRSVMAAVYGTPCAIPLRKL